VLAALAVAGLVSLPQAGWAESWDNWRYAVKAGQESKVSRMVDAGQDINAQNDEGWTALHVAAEDGNERMVRWLLAHGARADIKTTRGRTAYDVAEGYAAVRAALRPLTPGAPGPGAADRAKQPGAPGTAAQAQPPAVSPGPVKPASKNEAYCKKMWREATALCGLGGSGSMCRIQASTRYSACLKRGTWY
jgi:hypothetical protein